MDGGIDLCPDDAQKTVPGVCGCGVADDDTNDNGVPDCLDPGIDLCPADPDKTEPGYCGCGIADVDADENNVPDCLDTCLSQGLSYCDGGCFDVSASDAHCGACGHDCGAATCVTGACTTGEVVFSFTGAEQTWVVPAGVTRIAFEVQGAQGGGSKCCDESLQDDGGLGGSVTGSIDVTPGETLYVYVGGKGVVEGLGGFNGGAAGGQWGGGGGGASDIRRGGMTLVDRVVVGGGGGGGNCGCPEHGAGGAGGGLSGSAGNPGSGGMTAGGGGTQVAGGAAGSAPGAAGALGTGGSTTASSYHIGGGGGGYYGGGGAYAAGGGGGSSFLGAAHFAATTAGQRAGDGTITIHY